MSKALFVTEKFFQFLYFYCKIELIFINIFIKFLHSQRQRIKKQVVLV